MAEEIYEDIKFSVSDIDTLPGNLYVIGGFVKAKTNLSLSTILPFLASFHSMEGEDMIEETKLAFLRSMLLGNLAEAKLILNEMKLRLEGSLSKSVPNLKGSKEEPAVSSFMSASNIQEDNNPILRIKPTKLPEQEETANHDEASEELIKKMMEEERQVSSSKSPDIFCSLCEEKLEDFYIFLDCSHIFDKQCFAQILQEQIQSGHSSLTCPLDTHRIPECEIRDSLSPEWFDRYQKNSIFDYIKNQQEELIFTCPLCLTPLQAEQMVNKFRCPYCKKEVCAKCKSQYHRGLTCQEANVPCPRCLKKGLALNGNSLVCECGAEICLKCREERCLCMEEI